MRTEDPRHRQRQHLGGPAGLDTGAVEASPRPPPHARFELLDDRPDPCSPGRSAGVTAVDTTFLPLATVQQMSSSVEAGSASPCAM